MKKLTKVIANTALLFLFTLLMNPHSSYAFQIAQEQEAFSKYSGSVVDSKTDSPLVFATLTIEDSNISTITNTEGEFSLKIPNNIAYKNIKVSFLGYQSKIIPLDQLTTVLNKIKLDVSVTKLSEVDLSVPKDAATLVVQTLQKKGENYFEDPTLMTAFYRETIKKRRKNVSLSEAVVNIYKTPYTSSRRDDVTLYKSRKSTNYDKLDTLALKLQGGPFNALFVDIMKYPDYIFSDDILNTYKFSFDRSTRVNDRLIYIVDFKQYENIPTPLFKGKLYIDAEKKILTSAIYSLNITDKESASKLFVRKKPKNANVWPTEVAYRVDYREKKNKWYYGYSNVLMTFKIDWDKKLFNSTYTMACEMAITDWKTNPDSKLPKVKERMKSSIILNDEAIGFSDPDFWGEYNIIEPEKSIESAIKKIQRQLKRVKASSINSVP